MVWMKRKEIRASSKIEKEENKMITTQQVVSSKNKDKSLKFAKLIPAVNYAFGPMDVLEKFVSKITDGDSTFKNVKPDVELSYDVPKEKISAHDPESYLFPAMLEHVQSFSKTPWTYILDSVTVARNLETKKAAIAELEPLDPVVLATGVYKTMTKNGVPKNIVEIQVRATLAAMQVEESKINEALEKMAA